MIWWAESWFYLMP